MHPEARHQPPNQRAFKGVLTYIVLFGWGHTLRLGCKVREVTCEERGQDGRRTIVDHVELASEKGYIDGLRTQQVTTGV